MRVLRPLNMMNMFPLEFNDFRDPLCRLSYRQGRKINHKSAHYAIPSQHQLLYYRSELKKGNQFLYRPGLALSFPGGLDSQI
jgi:hypothetical protein